jgi:hypothetical protein
MSTPSSEFLDRWAMTMLFLLPHHLFLTLNHSLLHSLYILTSHIHISFYILLVVLIVNRTVLIFFFHLHTLITSPQLEQQSHTIAIPISCRTISGRYVSHWFKKPFSCLCFYLAHKHLLILIPLP